MEGAGRRRAISNCQLAMSNYAKRRRAGNVSSRAYDRLHMVQPGSRAYRPPQSLCPVEALSVPGSRQSPAAKEKAERCAFQNDEAENLPRMDSALGVLLCQITKHIFPQLLNALPHLAQTYSHLSKNDQPADCPQNKIAIDSPTY